MKMKKILIAVIGIINPSYSMQSVQPAETQSDQIKQTSAQCSVVLHVLTKAELRSSEIYEQLKTIFLNVFKQACADVWSQEFASRKLEMFDVYIKSTNLSCQSLVVAKKGQTIVGWALFGTDSNSKVAVLELMCVDPTGWRDGIGRKLVFSILDIFPQTESIALMTSTLDAVSPQFYQQIGFQKCDLMPLELLNDGDQGYMWKRNLVEFNARSYNLLVRHPILYRPDFF